VTADRYFWSSTTAGSSAALLDRPGTGADTVAIATRA
jgi:hypothetical protein